jgi:hypothetical protein
MKVANIHIMVSSEIENHLVWQIPAFELVNLQNL